MGRVRLLLQMEEQLASLAREIGNLQAALSVEIQCRQNAERACGALESSLDHTTRQLASKMQAAGAQRRSHDASGGAAAASRHEMETNSRHFVSLLEARAEMEAAVSSARAAELDRDAALMAVSELRDLCERLEAVAADERTAHAQARAEMMRMQHELDAVRRERVQRVEVAV